MYHGIWYAGYTAVHTYIAILLMLQIDACVSSKKRSLYVVSTASHGERLARSLWPTHGIHRQQVRLANSNPYIFFWWWEGAICVASTDDRQHFEAPHTSQASIACTPTDWPTHKERPVHPCSSFFPKFQNSKFTASGCCLTDRKSSSYVRTSSTTRKSTSLEF